MSHFHKINYNSVYNNKTEPKIALYRKPNVYIGRGKEVSPSHNELVYLLRKNTEYIENLFTNEKGVELEEYSLPKSLLPKNCDVVISYAHPKVDTSTNYWIKTALYDKDSKQIILRSFVRNPNSKEKKMNLVNINSEYSYHRSELCAHSYFWIELYKKLQAIDGLMCLSELN